MHAIKAKPIQFAARLRSNSNGLIFAGRAGVVWGLQNSPHALAVLFHQYNVFSFSSRTPARQSAAVCEKGLKGVLIFEGEVKNPVARRLERCFFQCATMTRRLDAISRLDVSQWIEAHGRLSARTTLRHNWMVTPESPDRVMWTQFNAAPYSECATNMRYQANRFKLFL